MAHQAIKTTHACRCLNVKLQLTPPAEQPPFKASNDSSFSLAVVSDGGILVEHTQLTRSKPDPLPDDPSQSTRHTTVSCLVCQMEVYRVRQVIPEAKDGPLGPTDDWVEKETLTSSDGWLEVHKNCTTGDALSQAVHSSVYSETFSLLLPSCLNSRGGDEPELSTTWTHQTPSTYSPGPFFGDVRPLFLPAPFTPSHPVFVYLSTLAFNKSQAARAAAEAEIVQAVKDRISQIEAFDNSLRREVEILWTRFKASLDGQRGPEVPTGRRNSDAWSGSTLAPDPKHGPVSVRNFVPTRITSPRTAPTISAMHPSSLSISLATSGMQHPKESQEHPSGPSSPVSAIDRGVGSSGHSGSPHTLSSSQEDSFSHAHLGVGTDLDQPFRRDMDQEKDKIASFRWFTIQAEMEKGRDSAALEGPSKAPSGTDGSEHGAGAPPKGVDLESTHQAAAKGKRKVTFDIQPNVVVTPNKVNADGQGKNEKPGEGAMIFDLDEHHDQSSSKDIQPILTFIEPIRVPIRRPQRRHSRQTSGQSLPASLSGLRPTSLPLPSHLPLPPPPPEPDASQTSPDPQRIPSPPSAPRRTIPSAEVDDPREAQILKLVAADTPSHRGTWTPGSKAWELFVRRQGQRTDIPLIPEEDTEEGDAMPNGSHGDDVEDILEYPSDYDASGPSIASSLPIPMSSIQQKGPQILSLASYQPEKSLHDAPNALRRPHPQKPARARGSSDAFRRAAYAERDLNRSIDPGALDFEADDAEGEAEVALPPEAGQRARERALQILQACSELPGEGMWRSLAS